MQGISFFLHFILCHRKLCQILCKERCFYLIQLYDGTARMKQKTVGAKGISLHPNLHLLLDRICKGMLRFAIRVVFPCRVITPKIQGMQRYGNLCKE